MKMTSPTLLLAAALLSTQGGAFADEPPKAPPEAALQAPAPGEQKPQGRDAEGLVPPWPRGTGHAAGGEPEFAPFDQVAKDFVVKEGLFPIYTPARPRREGILEGFFEIPGMRLERPFLLAMSFAGGTTFTGWQWGDSLLFWRLHDKQLLLIERNVQYRATKGSPVEDAVRRTYTDRLVLGLPIATRSPRGGFLVSLKDLFAHQASHFFGGEAARLDPSLAVFSKLKAFPENLEVAVTMPPRGGGPFVTLHYSLRDLGNSSYKTRKADDRVGFFLTVAKDFSQGAHDDERFVRFINRWHLEKLDANLSPSPVKDPIVFYLEKSIPIEYRRFVRDGIMEWNKAFEQVGFINAVEARQQTELNEFKDFDPEDARYNFFRWITSESAFAMGPSRTNPETGQILDADIVFDDSMISSTLLGYEQYIENQPKKPWLFIEAQLAGQDPESRLLLESLRPVEARAGLSDFDKSLFEALAQRSRLERQRVCFFGHHKIHELALARLAVGIQGKLPLDFIGQTIKETVMHEVGHTLGLRHNFAASTFLTLEAINSAEKPAITTGSVMDYNPVNVAVPGALQGRYQTTTLGPYDHWAIEYGYSDKADDKGLLKIASRCAEPGLTYATDEDASGPDPYVNRWDMGADPLSYSKKRVDLAKSLLQNLEQRALKTGDGYGKLRTAFGSLLYEYAGAAGLASRFIGGVRIHRHHVGDPNAKDPLEPVAAAQQREALKFIFNEVFGAYRFEFSPNLLRRLGGQAFDGGDSFPIHRAVTNIQKRALDRVTSSRTLQHLLDTELQAAPGEDVVTVPELFESLTASITSELDAKLAAIPAGEARKAAIGTVRRDLQRAYIARLIEMAIEDGSGGTPQAARTLAWHELKNLKKKIERFLDDNKGVRLDRMSLAHLEESQTRLERALEAAYQIGGGGGGGGGFFIIIGKDGKPTRVESKNLDVQDQRR